MKVLLIGASGLLGTELLKLNPEMDSPSHDQLDIVYADIRGCDAISKYKPDIIINCAAVINNREIEQNPHEAIMTNIVGAANVAAVCLEKNIRYVYISTDYVYHGDRGNYSEDDEILPNNLYAWTKLGGECSARAVKDHLIIRTSFGANKFPYLGAFTNKWTSKDYVDKIAPMILEAATSPLIGVINIGTERKTMYEHASERNVVSPEEMASSNNNPRDTSMDLNRWFMYKSKSISKPHTNCRVCGSGNLKKYLDLGLQPLANNLEDTAEKALKQERFPLQMLFCEECGLSQTSVIIEPKTLFSHYVYRSSVNKPYIEHCRKMVKTLRDTYGLTKDSFHIDIASNDSALLKEFKDEIGLKVLGVDPAENLAAIAETKGIHTIVDFWSLRVSSEIVKEYGKADLITATNVFAHVDNVVEFIQAAKNVLSDTGVLIIECPYLIDYIDKMEFNQTYFEHLSTMSIHPMKRLCESLGMKIIDVEKQSIHGGTIRVTIAHKYSNCEPTSVARFMDRELTGKFMSFTKYSNWDNKVQFCINEFIFKLIRLKQSNARIVGIGASAKGVTLLNCVKATPDIIEAIIDETPEKIGKFSPGTGIPIVNKDYFISNKPDYCVILAENFKDELMKRAKESGFEGKFIIPLPVLAIIDSKSTPNLINL